MKPNDRFLKKCCFLSFCFLSFQACGSREDESKLGQQKVEHTNEVKKNDLPVQSASQGEEKDRVQKLRLLKNELDKLSDCSEADSCFAKKKMIEDTIRIIELRAKQANDIRKFQDDFEKDMKELKKLDNDVIEAEKKYTDTLSKKNE